MGRKIAYILGRSNVDIDGTTKHNDCLFSFPAIPQSSHGSNDLLFVFSLRRGVVIPSENPNIRAAFALYPEKASLLIPVHTISFALFTLRLTTLYGNLSSDFLIAQPWSELRTSRTVVRRRREIRKPCMRILWKGKSGSTTVTFFTH
jgi:hypothetical protein